VTIVGGFQQWREQRRAVRKGESALAIWIPRKDKEDPNRQPGEISSPDLKEMQFFMGNVFDISQTQPIEAE